MCVLVSIGIYFFKNNSNCNERVDQASGIRTQTRSIHFDDASSVVEPFHITQNDDECSSKCLQSMSSNLYETMNACVCLCKVTYLDNILVHVCV